MFASAFRFFAIVAVGAIAVPLHAHTAVTRAGP